VRSAIIAFGVWVLGIPAVILGGAALLYAWDEYQWRRDEKRGARRLVLLRSLQELEELSPPHERRHS
jgi:hypothetical protein